MKIVIGDLALSSEDIIRFQKHTVYSCAYINVVTKDKSKTGECMNQASFSNEQERDAAYDKLVELWSGGDVVRI